MSVTAKPLVRLWLTGSHRSKFSGKRSRFCGTRQFPQALVRPADTQDAGDMGEHDHDQDDVAEPAPPSRPNRPPRWPGQRPVLAGTETRRAGGSPCRPTASAVSTASKSWPGRWRDDREPPAHWHRSGSRRPARCQGGGAEERAQKTAAAVRRRNSRAPCRRWPAATGGNRWDSVPRSARSSPSGPGSSRRPVRPARAVGGYRSGASPARRGGRLRRRLRPTHRVPGV
jgi:hypothetical protein